jgi:hypothetical protein
MKTHPHSLLIPAKRHPRMLKSQLSANTARSVNFTFLLCWTPYSAVSYPLLFSTYMLFNLPSTIFRHEALQDNVFNEELTKSSKDDLRIDFAAALESLHADYLEVLLLEGAEALNISEIAQRLNEQNGVIERLHRPREFLREYCVDADRYLCTQ